MAHGEKWWHEKDAVIGRVGVVSHHLQSLLGIIEYTRNYETKLTFLIISSTPSLKKYRTNFKPLFLAGSTYFARFSVYLP